VGVPDPLKRPRKGRGAVGNPEGRFERFRTEPFDDGWGSLEDEAEQGAGQGIPTTVTPMPIRRAVFAKNDSPDVPFTRSINPYKGCEHGCTYCFARPSHSYMGLSPGLDFETRIFSRPNAAEMLRRELRKPGYRCEPIALGTNTDPYQPAERRLGITRSILEVLFEHRHPFSIVTKSNLVLRDLDLIGPLARDGLAAVYLSVTTLDNGLARVMEPRAPTPARRVEALAALVEAGVPSGAMAAPMIPEINDHELEAILEAAAGVGVEHASYLLVRLPWEIKDLFADWLDAHFPGRKQKVLGYLRSLRGGRLNDPRFGTRMRGEGPYADLLQRRFRVACKRLGLNSAARPGLDTAQFRMPPAPGDQATLF
jgi:DNA repair photolyase